MDIRDQYYDVVDFVKDELEKIDIENRDKLQTAMSTTISNSNNNITIDKLYTEKTIQFEINNSKVNIYNSAVNKLEELDINGNTAFIQKKIKYYNNKINKINTEISNYYLKNSTELNNYFQIYKDREQDKNSKTIVYEFFYKNTKNIQTSTSNTNTDNDKKHVNIYLRNNNFNLYNSTINNVPEEDITCPKCNIGELIQSTYDGIIICNHCSCVTNYLINNDNPSYKEPPTEISFYAYRRINHFKEILAQFQAKETTNISEADMNLIKLQIKNERIPLSKLTTATTKNILKKLGLNDYYEHIAFIKDKLGVKPPVMSRELEELLCNLFIDIQIPYAKYCPSDRVNFLNYYYTLYKLCELLGERKYLKDIPLLKEDKKREQDVIWKKICNDMGWLYIPTV